MKLIDMEALLKELESGEIESKEQIIEAINNMPEVPQNEFYSMAPIDAARKLLIDCSGDLSGLKQMVEYLLVAFKYENPQKS